MKLRELIPSLPEKPRAAAKRKLAYLKSKVRKISGQLEYVVLSQICFPCA